MTNKEGYVKVTHTDSIPCGKTFLVEDDDGTSGGFDVCAVGSLCPYCEGRKRGREEKEIELAQEMCDELLEVAEKNYEQGFESGEKKGREERDAYWKLSVEQLAEHDNKVYAKGKEAGRLEAAKKIIEKLRIEAGDRNCMGCNTAENVLEWIEKEFGVEK